MNSLQFRLLSPQQLPLPSNFHPDLAVQRLHVDGLFGVGATVFGGIGHESAALARMPEFKVFEIVVRKIKLVYLFQLCFLVEQALGIVGHLFEAIGENGSEGFLILLLVILPCFPNLAFENLGRRVPLLEVNLFISAVELHARTGGKLSEEERTFEIGGEHGVPAFFSSVEQIFSAHGSNAGVVD